MESEYNLKPCPFCGNKAELIVAPGYFKSGLSSSGWLVKCTNGCCNQMPYMSDHDAVEAWNRRETRGYVEQIKWERDLAIQQLKDLGYGLGEKPRTNSDTISRQAAIDALNEYFVRIGKLKRRGLNKGEKAISLDTVGAIKTLPSAHQWIPCSERLPEVNGRYLVTRGLNACGSLWNRTYIANYSDLMGIKSERIWWQGNVGKIDFERLDDVLAWMPLSKPYAERRQE